MDKLTKAILWGTGILVALIIALTTYSTISGNYDIGGYFAAGVMITVFGIVICSCFIDICNFFYYKLRQKKVLYLYKENTKVKNYYDNLENFEKLFFYLHI